MAKKRAASESLSDDSLVVTPQKSKKTKVAKSSASAARGPSVGSATATLTTPEGDDYWEIPAGSKRRVTVSMFKSTPLVSVREYYEAGGEMKPGKKGISLTVPQFSALVEALPAIEESLRKKGHTLPRPVYEAGSARRDDPAAMDEDPDEDEEEDHDDEEDEDEDEDAGKRRAKAARKKGQKANKRNIEETSDEGE